VKTPKGKQPSSQGQALTLFDDEDEAVTLPAMTASEHVVQDYATMSLSLKGHPVGFIRDNLRTLRAVSAEEHRGLQNGQFIRVAGLVLVRQRPGTASGTCFITLEDETGTMNLIVWTSLFDEFRQPILGSKLLMAEGHLQIEREVVHVIVQRCYNLNHLLGILTQTEEEDLPLLTLSRGDDKEGKILSPDGGRIKAFPGGRNFK
jgi:error-prone DNA polymerase